MSIAKSLRLPLLYLAVAVNFLLSTVVYAGDTGKIIGKVVDDKGQPLPGAIVTVVGTTRGAQTDLDGKFTIIGVPIGTYELKASMVGFAAQTLSNVKIGADETTSKDFKLGTGDVTVQTIETSADKDMVNSMNTSAKTNFSSKQIEEIPAVKDVQDVVAMSAGVVRQGNNLFLRGGRANEVVYLVDGVPTNQVIDNSANSNANASLAALYSATGYVGGGLSVSANAIQSVNVQTSGFDADYGNAQSGIVSITTKSGGDRYSGSAQYRTDKLVSLNQNEKYGSLSFGGPEPITKYLLPSFGVDLPGSLTFFLTGDMDRNDGAYLYNANQFYQPLQRRVEFSGFLGGLLNGAGFNYSDNLNNKFSADAKLRYTVGNGDEMSYRYTTSLGSQHSYESAYTYLADSSQLNTSLSTNHAISLSHFFSQKTYVKLLASKEEDDGEVDVAGLNPTQYSNVYTYQKLFGSGYNNLGQDQTWQNSKVNQYDVRLDFTSQVHPLHLLKAGVEFQYFDIASTSIQDPTISAPDSNGNNIPPPFPPYIYGGADDKGLYPGYGKYRYVLSNYPNQGAAYLQDNIEFSGLNLHVGLRYDYFDIGRQVYYQDFITAWERATFNTITPDWVGHLKNGSSFQYYALHGNFSPRLSIGYPVTERIVFYFNYGDFLQYPSREEYYSDPSVIESGATFGNPDLKPQRTVQYESGFEDQFNDEMSFSVHAFYKDIFDYVSTISFGNENMYQNLDYASARGFELGFNQQLASNFSMNVSYTYQIATGRSSNPLASVFDSLSRFLPRETRLDWDQENTANVFLRYNVGKNEEGHFFGLPFVNNYGISLTYNYGSGDPYTPYFGNATEQTLYLVNSQTMPYVGTLNLSVFKGFQMTGSMNLLFTLDVTNLLNRTNVTQNQGIPGFNNVTGQPFVFGDADPSSHQIYSYNSLGNYLVPLVFGPPRQVLLGLRLDWN